MIPKLIIYVQDGVASYVHDLPELDVLVLDYDYDNPKIPDEFIELAEEVGLI